MSIPLSPPRMPLLFARTSGDPMRKTVERLVYARVLLTWKTHKCPPAYRYFFKGVTS